MPLVVAWASLPMNPGQEARDTKNMGREAHATQSTWAGRPMPRPTSVTKSLLNNSGA
jgi:hypothetical protein